MEMEELLSRVSYIQDAAENARRLYQDRLAPDFSPFNFIVNDEMQLSRILAWALDPNGTHGQGDRFLILFLKELNFEWSAGAYKSVETKTEFSVGGDGRIDIFVKSQDYILAIENKPWAGDQEKQVKRYLDYLDKQEIRYRLVYLTRDGSEAENLSVYGRFWESLAGFHRVESSNGI
jgi:PD-(D/E)XK nuclease superfamily